jgi:hypothetical protein
MKLFLAIFLVGHSAAQNAPPRDGKLQTFTSPDGSFQFEHSDLLIHCEQRAQPGGYAWIQNECVAYFPTCDEGIGLDQKTTIIACFAYPRNKHTNTGAFEAATFSVAGVDSAADEKSCLSPPLDQLDRRVGTTSLGGIDYVAFETGEAGMNQHVSANVYRTLHGTKCYQLTIAAAGANAEVFDPPERKLTKEDWAEVHSKLNQARDTFRFLK